MHWNHSSNKWSSLGVKHTVKRGEAELIWRPFCRRHFGGIFLKDNCHTLIIKFTEIWTWGYIRQQSGTGTVERWNKVTTVTLFPTWPLPDQTEQVRVRYAVFPWIKSNRLFLLCGMCSCCLVNPGARGVFTGLLVSVHRVDASPICYGI